MLNKLFFISLLTISTQANAWSWWPFGGGSVEDEYYEDWSYAVGTCVVTYHPSWGSLPWELRYKNGSGVFATKAEADKALKNFDRVGGCSY